MISRNGFRHGADHVPYLQITGTRICSNVPVGFPY
jgi:hypothetical protein